MSIRTILLTTAAVALLSINGSGAAFAKNGADDQQTEQADTHQKVEQKHCKDISAAHEECASPASRSSHCDEQEYQNR